MTRTWLVEIDQGAINWMPIAQCFSEKQANDLAKSPHIVDFGKPVRVREYGEPASQQEGKP